MKTENLNIDQIISLEPRVDKVINAARRARSRTWRTYERLKKKLDGLVGYNANQPELRTSAAYEVTLRAMSATLYQSKTGDHIGMG